MIEILDMLFARKRAIRSPLQTHNEFHRMVHMTSSCPQCSSKAFKRNGYTRHGKQNHRCLDCGRQFSLEPAERGVSENKADLMEDLLAQRYLLENVI
jgi:transposase-like protein